MDPLLSVWIVAFYGQTDVFEEAPRTLDWTYPRGLEKRQELGFGEK